MQQITGIENVSDSKIFHAGTKLNDNQKLITSGGRVLVITSLGNNLEESLALSNKNAEKIQFDKKYYRHDIGKDLLKL